MRVKKLKVGTFMGKTQKVRDLLGFTLSRTDHGQHMKVPKHEHEYPYISLLLRGMYHEKSIVAEHDIKAGSSLLRPMGFEHKNEIGSLNSVCFNIEIEKEFPTDGPSLTTEDYIQFERNNLEIFKIYFGFQNGLSDELLTMTVEENLHLLFQERYLDNRLGRALWVNKIKKEVRLNPDKKYSINEVADSLCLHPNYFVRKFKSKTGLTFGEFVLRQRLSTGLDLMLHTSKSLTEIAIYSGFYDQSHFIRHFSRYFGTTPYHYRQVIKG